MALPTISRKVQCAIALLLLGMFAACLFLPIWIPGFAPDPDLKTTMMNATTAVVTYFLTRAGEPAEQPPTSGG